MKASQFSYLRPSSLGEAVDLLSKHGDSARILAGGQSLLAMLNMRLVEPEVLLDISRIEDLSGVSESGGKVQIGAMTKHADVMKSAIVKQQLPLINQAMPYVAHAAIRSMGTFGGSLAHADPAAEMPACVVALNPIIEAHGPQGKREIQAEDFFLGLFETALKPDEILTGVRFDAHHDNDWNSFTEISRRHGDYAMAGLAAHGTRDNAGMFTELRLVCFSISDRPVLAKAAAKCLVGVELSAENLRLAQQALADDLEPFGDLYTSAEMKLHLSKVVLERALGELVKK